MIKRQIRYCKNVTMLPLQIEKSNDCNENSNGVTSNALLLNPGNTMYIFLLNNVRYIDIYSN